jgi:hypothetical protein
MLPAFLAPMNEGIAVIDKAKKALNGTNNDTSTLQSASNKDIGAITKHSALTTLEKDKRLREIVFGITKPYDKMNGPERLHAFKNFHEFVCAHSNGTLVIPPEAIPEAKLTTNAIAKFKC